MSSYPGGAWDGGPPGAEADYVPPQVPAAPMPTTDPWTGVSYSQYGSSSNYDYSAYGASNASAYGYHYDPRYYQHQSENYYEKYRDAQYGQQLPSYDYTSSAHPSSKSPGHERSYSRSKSYRSQSKSLSPHEKQERVYSVKRGSYDESSVRHRSGSNVRKSKRSRYSSADSDSSRSRSPTPTLRKSSTRRQSRLSESPMSERSYRSKKFAKSRVRDPLTPPLKRHSRSVKQSSSHSESTSRSRSPIPKERKKNKIERKVVTPPRKRKVMSPTRTHRSERSSLTPPRSYKIYGNSSTPPKKHRNRKSFTPPRKKRDSITPSKSYARDSSSCSSHSTLPTPKHSRRKSHGSRSTSSTSSHGGTHHRSYSKSHSKSRSISNSPLSTRFLSKSKVRRSKSPKVKSRSQSRSPRTERSSHTPSDDERRGQFTVADRKRYWKLHRSLHPEKGKEKTPPKELKPPPGAVEPAKVDDIEYGDPPEVEGPNFADLLPSPEEMLSMASTSKPKIPIAIKNDGSFLEMFKKMQEATKKEEEKKPQIKKPVLPFIGKRRGGRVLKTGMVKKAKAIDEQPADNNPKDAWSLYMQEVKKYRETSCEEERKTRPLVK